MIETVRVKVKKVKETAIVPKYQTEGSGCFDLHTCFENTDEIVKISKVNPIGRILDTGIAFEIPEGYGMLVYSRSGHGFKYQVTLANGTGIIDSDYRDSVKVKLVMNPAINNDTERELVIKHGDRIAQAMIIPIPKIELIEVEELSDTKRGLGGFGSTGQ